MSPRISARLAWSVWALSVALPELTLSVDTVLGSSPQ
jgi:hypothetical protein